MYNLLYDKNPNLLKKTLNSPDFFNIYNIVRSQSNGSIMKLFILILLIQVPVTLKVRLDNTEELDPKPPVPPTTPQVDESCW